MIIAVEIIQKELSFGKIIYAVLIMKKNVVCLSSTLIYKLAEHTKGGCFKMTVKTV